MSHVLSEHLSDLLDAPVDVKDVRPLSGGCISEVLAVSLESDAGSGLPGRLVVKRNAASMIENFQCEADGLRAIEASGSIRVPKPLAAALIHGNSYLAMEFIESGKSASRDQLFDRFGRALANFHRVTRGHRIGWKTDNYLGAAPQSNQPSDSWPEFFAEQRLRFQLRWTTDQQLADSTLTRDVEQIIHSITTLLDGREDSTSLLHGDLWSGNYLFDTHGEPVLLDPAVYHGCREAEWGMIRLFGGCPPAFEEAYQDEWRMPAGWRRRSKLYLLYHELNHLNLFGTSYLSGCKSTASEILAET